MFGTLDIGSTHSAALMRSLSLLLFQNGVPDLPVVLIEPHRNHGGIWRIKSSAIILISFESYARDEWEPYTIGARWSITPLRWSKTFI
jgi:hypothetical protein